MDVRKFTAAKIKEYRKKRGLTQKELGEKIGVKHNTISGYENGNTEPEQDILFKLAKALEVSINDLFPPTSINFSDHFDVSIPIYGVVTAGEGGYADNHIEGYLHLIEEARQYQSGEVFALIVHGDSMSPKMENGDIILVRKLSTPINGKYCVMIVNGDESTVKKVIVSEKGITLIAINSAVYEPHFYTFEEVENLPVRCAGVVIEVRKSV